MQQHGSATWPFCHADPAILGEPASSLAILSHCNARVRPLESWIWIDAVSIASAVACSVEPLPLQQAVNASTAKTGDWPRSRLVDVRENGIKLASLVPGDAHIFHYPYVTTPCFLLRLGSGTVAGSWPGGLGDDASEFAFSAICSHKMSHPARSISHITCRAVPVVFTDDQGVRQEQAGLIS